MSKKLTKGLRELVKELIFNISGFDEQSEYYETVEDFAFSHICSPDYFFSENRRDIEKTINNLAEKIKFHGFSAQANAIQKLTKTFLDSAPNKDDLEKKLYLMKLIIQLSHSPTTHYIENPSFYTPKLEKEEEEVVDWSSLLNEPKSRVIQTFSDSSGDWSELSETSSEGCDSILRAEDQIDATKTTEPIEIKPTISLQEQAKIAKDELVNTIQYKWWNDDLSIGPTSDKSEANIASDWDAYQYEESLCLYSPKTKIIPEYKVMREIIWQLFSPSSCCCFAYEGNHLVPKDDVTIASVRANSMKLYLQNFLPYFEMMKVFRSFKDGIDGQYFESSTPDTYRSYYNGVAEVLEPVYDKIMEIGDIVRQQDETITILLIAKQLRPVFLNVELLYTSHLEIFQNRTDDLGDSFKNTTFLLSKLYFAVLNASNTKEQNIFLSLYLNSLYKYFTTIEIWLGSDYLNEETDEFLITQKIGKTLQTDCMYIDYKVKELDPFSKMDGMLQIICKKIVQLAKNIHLLRLLGKLHLVTEEQGTQQVSLHEEYVNKVIKEARKYVENDDEKAEKTSEVISSIENSEDTSTLTVICPEQMQSANGIDSIENFVDFSDGFLVTVFEDYLYQKPSVKKEKKQTLFSQIDENITKLFPSKQILEKCFLEVLETRYSVPGLVVKNILINQFELKKYFSLIKHLYLFVDDLIFPFYKFMFTQYENQANMWGNFFWLTSQLQDLLMDLYPDSYESFRVDVAPNWRTCTSLVLGCDLVTVHTKIEWPINLIIRPEHIALYNKVFQFILKIKWALNTLNQLKFTDIEPRDKPFAQQPNLIKKRIRLLQNMRFFLLSDMTSVQHYILGHLIHVLSENFDKDLEASYDLETIRKAHDTFIKRIYSFCMKLKDENSDVYGFKKILSLIGYLQIMWNDIHNIRDTFLSSCETDYRRCHKFLRPIIQMETVNF